MQRRPFKGVLWADDRQEVVYGKNISRSLLMVLKSLKGILWTKLTFALSSIDERPYKDHL